jgi:hypothetical protein
LIIRAGGIPGLLRATALAIGLLAVLGSIGPVRAASIWTQNLYVSRAFLYQDPYGTACIAASTMIMLNTMAYRGTGGDGFRWTPTRTKNDPNRSNIRDLSSIQYFARTHDTLNPLGAGSDPHGWRNALNYYGWGNAAMTSTANMVYDDRPFTTFDAALREAVKAIARFGKPVGIVSWAGRHAQVMTGYVAEGENPATSDAFVVRAVYLSDPLRSSGYVNIRISTAQFRSGNLHYRFQAYRQMDSRYDDVYTAGWKRSAVSPVTGPSEWYRRWVIVAPIRAGLPTATPPPSPTPSPTPTPTEPPTPTDAPTPSPTPSDPIDANSAGATQSIAPQSESPSATPSPSPEASAPG